MTMAALIMMAQIISMRGSKVEPRVLADDLMFTASGKHHRSSTIRAMKESKEFFQPIGARIADKECFTFSTEPSIRKHLKEIR